MNRTAEILTEEIVNNNETNSEGIKAKKVSLTNRNIYELAFVEEALRNGGLNISASQLIRLCLDKALPVVHEYLNAMLIDRKKMPNEMVK
jgi:hypothetical protein